MNKRFVLQIAIVAILMSVFNLFVMVAAYKYLLDNTRMESETHSADLVSAAIASRIRNHLLYGDTRGIYENIQELFAYNDRLMQVVIRKGDGSGKKFVVERQYGSGDGENRLGNAIDREQSGLYGVEKVVYYDKKGGEPLATIQFTYKRDRQSFFSTMTIKFFVFATAYMVVVTLVLLILLNKKLTGPLKELFAGLDGVIEGSRKRISVYSNDVFPIVSKVNAFRKKYDNALNELENKSRLAAIGQTVAMVAHDVRKPIASMKVLLSTLDHIKDDPDQLQLMIASVDRSIVRTNVALDDILEFSRESKELELRESDIRSIVTSAIVDALRNKSQAKVEIEYSFKHKHVVRVDGNRIIRVLTNIIENAVDAMTTNHAEGEVSQLSIQSSEIRREKGVYIKLEIVDSGPGVPAEFKDKIFDPFFTYAKKGGTGLGLAICKRIIDMHDGNIDIMNNEDGNGAIVIVELLAGEELVGLDDVELIRHSDELRAFREEESKRLVYGESSNLSEFMRLHKEHGKPFYLLVVDDEPLFRESVRSLINVIPQVRDHIKVIETDTAEAALELFRKQRFDYAIVDIDLGRYKMNGYQCARKILECYSYAKVLIHSNKRREDLDQNIRGLNSSVFMGFLPKPMKRSEMLQFLACKTFETKGNVGIFEEEVKRKNILVVNDDDDLLIMLNMLLKSPNRNLIEAKNVRDAMEIMSENNVDVVISDINLGKDEEDGYELLKKVRQMGETIPFYMVSGYSSKVEAPKAKDLGADGYFQLPVEPDELEAVLK